MNNYGALRSSADGTIYQETPEQFEARPGKHFADAKDGDMTKSGRWVVRRRMRPKRDALALVATNPNYILSLDGPRHWAVMSLVKPENANG